MRARSRRGNPLPIALGLLLAAGCASPSGDDLEATAPGALWAAPAWVLGGCRASEGERDSASLCAVGSATGSGAPSFLRATAVGRGRTEIARQLFAGVKGLLRESAATEAAAGAPGEGRERDRRIVDLSKQITEGALAGAETAEDWESQNGSVYALVRLDVQSFTESVSHMDSLSEPIRRAVVERAGRIFGGPADEGEAGEER